MTPRRNWKAILFNLVFFLCFALIGMGFGYTAGKLLKASGAKAALSGWHLALVPVLSFLVIAWHELGHVAGGWLSGFQLTLFIVGPLKIERTHGELKVRWNTSLGLAGGLAATSPPGETRIPQEEMKRALFRIVAGGPLFSASGALLLVPAYLLHSTNLQAAIPLAFTGALSCVIAMATMVPLATGGFRSDGARILQLLRGGEAADRWAYLGLLAGLTYTVRPRDWPRDLVTAASKLGERSFDAVSGAWLRSCHHEDRGELNEALVWIEEALDGKEQWPKPAHSILHATAAHIHAVLADAASARRHIEQMKQSGFLPKEQSLHAEAAVLFAEGRNAEAREAARKALALIPKDAQGSAAAQREDLEHIAAQTNP